MTMLSLNDFIGAAGEMTLALGFVILLIWDVTSKDKDRAALAWVTSLLFVIAAGVSVVFTPNGLYFAGTFRIDPFSTFIKLFASAAGIFGIWMSLPRFHKNGEYYLLLAAVVFGMYIVASASDFIVLIVGLETVSVPSYILAGYYRANRKSGEAALKYVLYGAVSIGMMLFGFSFLYGITGETTYSGLRDMLDAQGNGYELVAFVAMVLMVAGFGYKIAAVPFHFWCPDVYEGAPTPMTAFFSVAPKAAGLAALARFLINAVPDTALVQFGWDKLFWWIAVATMTLGNLAALPQTNLKRLLAYSSIAHAGYIFTVFTVNSTDGYAGLSFYLIAYLFMNIGAFAVVEWIERTYGSVNLEVYRGLGKRDPFTAVMFAIFLFSLVGIPPLAGFVGKYMIFNALIKANQTSLALIAVINTVVSLVYYTKIAKEMFLTDSAEELNTKPVSSQVYALLLTCAVPTFILGTFPGLVIKWVNWAAEGFVGKM